MELLKKVDFFKTMYIRHETEGDCKMEFFIVFFFTLATAGEMQNLQAVNKVQIRSPLSKFSAGKRSAAAAVWRGD